MSLVENHVSQPVVPEPVAENTAEDGIDDEDAEEVKFVPQTQDSDLKQTADEEEEIQIDEDDNILRKSKEEDDEDLEF